MANVPVLPLLDRLKILLLNPEVNSRQFLNGFVISTDDVFRCLNSVVWHFDGSCVCLYNVR